MSLVRQQDAAKDEAGCGEKVQLHGNRDDQSSPELQKFNAGQQHETGGHEQMPLPVLSEGELKSQACLKFLPGFIDHQNLSCREH